MTGRAYGQTLRTITDSGTRVLVIRDVPSAVESAPDRSASAGERVDDRHAEQHREHAERHPPPEERGHRAGSGTGTAAGSGRRAAVTRTRGRRCDS